MSESPALPSTKLLKLELLHDDGVLLVVLNREKRKNAVNFPVYEEITLALEYAEESPTVRCVVLTGAGDYYSSGNDLAQFTTVGSREEMITIMKQSCRMLDRFMKSFINLSKVLIAAVNGPAIGDSCTTLGLCDYVYCTKSNPSSGTGTFFSTPFTISGQSAEGCSSYMFPKLLGTRLAFEVIQQGKRLSPEEAHRRGFVSEILDKQQVLPHALNVAKQLADLPPQSVQAQKRLMRPQEEKDKLIAVSNREIEELMRRWESEEFMSAVLTFMSSLKQRPKL